MIFDLKNWGLWAYVNSIIIKPMLLLSKEETIAKAKQETQNKIGF